MYCTAAVHVGECLPVHSLYGSTYSTPPGSLLPCQVYTYSTPSQGYTYFLLPSCLIPKPISKEVYRLMLCSTLYSWWLWLVIRIQQILYKVICVKKLYYDDLSKCPKVKITAFDLRKKTPFINTFICFYMLAWEPRFVWKLKFRFKITPT